MKKLLTIMRQDGTVQSINLHPSFNSSEKVNKQVITPGQKAYDLAMDIAGSSYKSHNLS